MNKNDNQILDEIKLNIAISEFGRRYKMRNSKMFILRKVAIIIFALIIIPIGYVQAQKNIVYFSNREPVYILNSISDAITDGYVEDLNMEYIYSDGIGLKIDSLMVSDNDINLVFNFKMSDQINSNGKNIEFGYLLYDENNEVYYNERNTNINLLKDFIKKNNLKKDYDTQKYVLSSQKMSITNTNENFVVSSTIYAKAFFPKAKKLFVEVTGIGNFDDRDKYKALSNSRWIFELDLPEKFYDSKPIKYELKELSAEIKLEGFFVTDTSSTLIAEIDGINNSGYDISIIDEFGNEYKTNEKSFSGINGDKITCRFSIRKVNVTDKMYLKIEKGDQEEIFDLIKK